MNIVKTLTVGTFLASTLVATGAFAKAHDQSDKNGNPLELDLDPPGENVHDETVRFAPARTHDRPSADRAATPEGPEGGTGRRDHSMGGGHNK